MRASRGTGTDLITTELPEFLWHGWGEEFLFSVHRQKTQTGINRTNPPMPKTQALARLREGWSFFGICPRVSNGQSAKHCSTHCDVVWCEIDLVGEVAGEQALDAAVTRLEEADLGIFPSAITYSGNRSPHLYFKLDERLPVAEIKGWNRLLAQRLGGDAAVVDIARVMRHPGSIHETTQRQATMLDFDRRLTPVAALEALGPQSGERADHPEVWKRPQGSQPTGEWLEAAEELGDWYERWDFDASDVLTLGNHRAYIQATPARGWSDPMYPSRNEAEHGIVVTLVRHGASDRQIRAFADGHLAKHTEKLGAGDESYLQRMIDSARERLYEQGWISHPTGGSPRKRDVKYRHTSTAMYQAALDLVRGQSETAWLSEIQAAGIAKQRTKYRIRDRLESEGLIEIGSDRCVRIPPVG